MSGFDNDAILESNGVAIIHSAFLPNLFVHLKEFWT